MSDTSVTISLVGLVVTLAGCLASVLRFVLQRTIPDMMKAHAAQVEEITNVFRRETDRDRSLALELHKSMHTAVERLGTAVEANQASLLVLLERSASANGQYPKMWKPPYGEQAEYRDPEPDDAA